VAPVTKIVSLCTVGAAAATSSVMGFISRKQNIVGSMHGANTESVRATQPKPILRVPLSDLIFFSSFKKNFLGAGKIIAGQCFAARVFRIRDVAGRIYEKRIDE
jgi:hypothetical protein